MVVIVREMGPLISGKSRLVKYYSIWPEISSNIPTSTSPPKIHTEHMSNTPTPQSRETEERAANADFEDDRRKKRRSRPVMWRLVF